MKIAITIELDKESAELFQVPFKNLSKQINELIDMFGKVDFVVEDAPDPEPPSKSQPQKKPKQRKKKSNSKIPVKATILKAIKEHKSGINTKDLQKQTGFTGKQISNNLFHLKKGNKVEKTKEGLYVALL